MFVAANVGHPCKGNGEAPREFDDDDEARRGPKSDRHEATGKGEHRSLVEGPKIKLDVDVE